MYSTLMSPEKPSWCFFSPPLGALDVYEPLDFYTGIIRLSISSAFHPSKQTQSGDAGSRAEGCLPSWLCHMLFGERSQRLGNNMSVWRQEIHAQRCSKTRPKEEYESHGRDAKKKKNTKQAERLQISPRQTATRGTRTRSTATDPRAG